METVGFILLTDEQGIKFDGAPKSALRKYIAGSTPHSPANVLRGELLLEMKQESPHFNYILSRDPNICLFCDENGVAPLNTEEYLLLEAVGTPYDRLDTFKNKLEWGVQLKTGNSVYTTIPGANLSVIEHARATIQYKGRIGKEPGINFGVEILQEKHRTAAIGTTDGTFQGKRYFTCEDKCGYFAPLHLMSPTSDVLSQVEGTPVDSADLSKGERNKHDYSGATRRDNSGASSQTPSQNPHAVSEGNKGPPQHVHTRPDLVKESSIDRPSKFRLGQHVAFHDNRQGTKHFGVVRWTGRRNRTKKLPYVVVGIQTDKDVYITDFENSVAGMSHLIPRVPNRRTLFLPETLVDKVDSVQDLIEENKRLSLPQNEAAAEIIKELRDQIQGLKEELQKQQQENQLKEELQKQQLVSQAQKKQIQGFKEVIQEQQLAIQAQENEIRAKNLDLQRKNEQIADLQHKVKIHDNEQMQLSAGNLQSWNIPRAEIQSIAKREIGHGAWGVVYSGTFRGEHVAIKQAHEDVLHTTTIDMLKREVKIMAHIQHPNLVRFIAAVLDDAVERGTDMPIIVSELMDINLRTGYRKHNLSSSLISIFCDVAYALHYLHQHRQPIIHRDLSAPNVLLKTLRNGAYQAKVSDFGSANLVKQASTTAAGAIVYSAPEMFPNEDITVPPEPQTTKVDVFSYGILLLEVIVKELPTRETRYTMLQRVNQRWKQMHELIVHCTKPKPSDRPTMADILNKLNRLPH